MVFSCDLIYLSAGCNNSPHCVAWNSNGLLLYGSDANVILCNPSTKSLSGNDSFTGFRAFRSLRHHTAPVNCVRWINDPANPQGFASEFISISSDKTCGVWSVCVEGEVEKSEVSMQQQIEHSSPLQVGKAIHIGFMPRTHVKKTTILALAGIDGVLSIWIRKDAVGFEIFQKISFGRGQILETDVTEIPETHGVLLACACDDGNIHVFGGNDTLPFSKVALLQGHEDWVRSVQFSAPDRDGILHLLSAGQDCTIRLWSVLELGNQKSDTEDLWNRLNRHEIRIPGCPKEYQIVYDTLLLGHEGWIYGAQWAPVEECDGKYVQPLRLLSSSMDKTAIVWEPESDFDGIWNDRVRVGEVGGNNLGFYGCQFSPDGRSILAYSFSGSFHLWTNDGSGMWKASAVTGGHFGSVNDLTWDPRGLYLLTASQDQTTRLHAPWIRKGEESEWHEISRPQVHGYDMQCLASTGYYSFASGADEKIIRLFRAPKNFLSLFHVLCKVEIDHDLCHAPEGAAVPALGLSNKPVFEGELSQNENKEQDERYPCERYPENIFHSKTYSQPPPEEDLMQNTLWSETHKLYGHGYEISSLACNYSRDLLASASRANHAEHAEIFLWQPQTGNKDHWALTRRLAAHQLTVTQMEFSHDDRFLLSVSRDRTWSLFKKCDSEVPYVLCARPLKDVVQSRIIWTCAWTPDDRFFATGSRDKTIFVYSIQVLPASAEIVNLIHKIAFEEPVTALDLRFYFGDITRYLLAVGTDGGHIQIQTFSQAEGEEPSHICSLDKHHETINRLRFKPSTAERKNELTLASCGIDRSVKIYQFRHLQA